MEPFTQPTIRTSLQTAHKSVMKLSRVTADKEYGSEPSDTVHWSSNHRAANWKKKEEPQDRSLLLRHTQQLRTKEELAYHGMSVYRMHIVGSVCNSVLLTTKWLYNCTHNVRILYTSISYRQHLCVHSPVCLVHHAMQDIAMQKACTGDSGY